MAATFDDVMAELKKLNERVEKLEKVAHPQHVMADPELSEALRRWNERFDMPRRYECERRVFC